MLSGLAIAAATAVGIVTWAPSTSPSPSPSEALVRAADGAPAATRLRDALPASATGPIELELDPADLPESLLAAGAGVPRTGGLTDLLVRYFGDRTIEAIVIVQCESSFDPGAVGSNRDGSQDHGLFQINDVHRPVFETVTGRSWSTRYDPEANTAFAAHLYRRSGWQPWTCERALDAADRALGE